MKPKSLLLALAAFFIPLLLASQSHATIQRVVVIKTDDVAAYVKELRKGQEMLDKMGSVQKLRVWRARFAGPDAGTVSVSVEYADLAEMAEDDKKVGANPEFQAWLKKLATMRRIVSDSLYDELKL